jgi:hypothetical protein
VPAEDGKCPPGDVVPHSTSHAHVSFAIQADCIEAHSPAAAQLVGAPAEVVEQLKISNPARKEC